MKKITQEEFMQIYKNMSPNVCFFEDYDFFSFDFSEFKFNQNIAFYNCDLRNASFAGAILSECDFFNCELSYADFSHSIISECKFDKCQFSSTFFKDTYIKNTIFDVADMSRIHWNTATIWEECSVNSACKMPDLPMACPRSGSFIGYKKCCYDTIVTLEIPVDAKRSSAFGKKCRCNKAKVLNIENIATGKKTGFAYSLYDRTFVYEVGKTVFADNFNENRYFECATGIHFFTDKQAAIHYTM